MADHAATKVSPIFVLHAHHSAWSGYPRFVDRLDGEVKVKQLAPCRIPRPVLNRISRRIVYDWCGPEELRLDLTAARSLVVSHNEIVHLLYGESSHFYAGRLRRVGHWRGNCLIATYHQPPAFLDQFHPAPPFEQLDHAIALGPRAASHLEGLLGPERVSLAFHGVDTAAWHPHPRFKAAVPTCAFVGSWFRDFDVFEDVVRLVHASEPRTIFEVVTEPAHVNVLSGLPGVRARSGVSDAELREVYWRAWVNVLPLRDAVANNALLEGLACGLPTVVSAVGDVTDYTGSHGALLAKPGDAEDMANAILKLLGDSHERSRLGSQARSQAETRDFTAVAARHAEIYHRVAA